MKKDIKRKSEEMSRMFNGVLYSSIEEMNEAKKLFKEQKAIKRKQKIFNVCGVASMICGIAVFPLTIVPCFGILMWFCSIFLGIFFHCKEIFQKRFCYYRVSIFMYISRFGHQKYYATTSKQ